MAPTRKTIAVIPVIVIAALPTLGVSENRSVQGEERSLPLAASVDLCTALEAVQEGGRLRVVVSGIYNSSNRLWDPFEPYCGGSVQPVTILEMASGTEKPTELVNLLEKEGQALATFSGVLWGKPRTSPDLPELHANRAYLMRMSGLRAYENKFTTKLVVDEISDIWPVGSIGAPRWHIADRSPFPVVKRAALPVNYPRQAANVGAFGDVVVEVELKMGNAVSTQVISAADRLLIEETLASIKSWEFDPAAEATFTTTFSYRFADLPATTASIQVHAELPVRMEIVAPRVNW